MKVGLTIGVIAVIYAVWMIGVAGEFEYPYLFTIVRAEHAKTINGARASVQIAQALGVAPGNLKWHRCSFCENFDARGPSNTIRVQISVESRENYAFAFDRKGNVLMPVDKRTAATFPALGSNVGRTTE